MKLIALKSNLKNGIDAAGRAVGSQLNLPVLGNILIKTGGNQIKISATNLELAITRSVFGKVVEEGGITVPYNTISNIINNIAGERVNLEKTKQGTLVLSADNYKATIQGVEEKEFPIIPRIDQKDEYAEVESPALKGALAGVIIACEASDIRPEIAGVFIEADGSSLKLAATDSFRLAEARILGKQVKNTFKKGVAATVPLKAAQEIARAAEEEGKTAIYIEKNQALFETEETSLITRLVEGEFPDYNPIIPKDISTEVLLEREELISALKLASSFAPRSYDVKLKTKNKKILEVFSSDSAVGENSYLIPAKISGPEMETTFNWKYLLDGARTGKTKELFLGLSSDESPAILKNPGDDSYFYILMPIKQA